MCHSLTHISFIVSSAPTPNWQTDRGQVAASGGLTQSRKKSTSSIRTKTASEQNRKMHCIMYSRELASGPWIKFLSISHYSILYQKSVGLSIILNPNKFVQMDLQWSRFLGPNVLNKMQYVRYNQIILPRPLRLGDRDTCGESEVNDMSECHHHYHQYHVVIYCPPSTFSTHWHCLGSVHNVQISCNSCKPI